MNTGKTRRIINCLHVTSTVITLSATRNYTKLVIPFFLQLVYLAMNKHFYVFHLNRNEMGILKVPY